jgi:hypothetical protein
MYTYAYLYCFFACAQELFIATKKFYRFVWNVKIKMSATSIGESSSAWSTIVDCNARV